MFPRFVSPAALCAAFVFTSVPLAAGPILYTMSWNGGAATLDTFDAANPNATTSVIGSLGVAADFGGLAYDTGNSTMYMVDGAGDDSTTDHSSLYTVNLATGAATLIGSTGLADVTGLTYDSGNNTLYAIQAVSGAPLDILNIGTGAGTAVGTQVSTNEVNNLAYDTSNGVFYAWSDCLGCAVLYSVNTGTGAGTVLNSTGLDSNDSGLVFDPVTGLLWDLDVRGDLTTIDPVAYTQSGAQLVSATGEASGLALIPTASSSVPEPSTIVLLAAGLAAVSIRRRR